MAASNAANISFTKLSINQAERIKPLWQKLNSLHHQRSIHFQDHFSSFTFEKRMEQLAHKKQISIHCAEVNNTVIGYCLCSIDDNTGEIDSIYVENSYRNTGLGSRLMDIAMDWLEESGAAKLIVSISHGNEDVMPFYHKYGFRPRLLILSKDVK